MEVFLNIRIKVVILKMWPYSRQGSESWNDYIMTMVRYEKQQNGVCVLN